MRCRDDADRRLTRVQVLRSALTRDNVVESYCFQMMSDERRYARRRTKRPWIDELYPAEVALQKGLIGIGIEVSSKILE